jgi:hypothetical protein
MDPSAVRSSGGRLGLRVRAFPERCIPGEAPHAVHEAINVDKVDWPYKYLFMPNCNHTYFRQGQVHVAKFMDVH